MWKKLSSKLLFTHPRLQVTEDTVQLESGEVRQYLRYGFGGNGATILARDGNNILFIREYSYVPNKKLLQLPMGSIEANEDPLAGAKRELQEETGLLAKNLELRGSYYQHHRRSEQKAFIFEAQNLSKAPIATVPEEANIELVWIPVTEIAERIEAGDICDADTLASLRICGL